MSEKKLYTWNFDRDEEWNNETFETIEECIKDAKNDCDYHGQTIYIGEKKDFEIEVDAGEILTELQNQAFYIVGEISDGWLDNLSENDVDELSDILSKQVKSWLEQHNELPWFYHVDNVNEC